MTSRFGELNMGGLNLGRPIKTPEMDHDEKSATGYLRTFRKIFFRLYVGRPFECRIRLRLLDYPTPDLIA